jgi:hypothetical protein
MVVFTAPEPIWLLRTESFGDGQTLKKTSNRVLKEGSLVDVELDLDAGARR